MNATIRIYNIALARLGGHQLGRVNAPDDDTTTAALCRTLFPHVRDMALGAFDWSFALRRVTLAKKTGSGAPGYPLRYALPADCLRVAGLAGPAGADVPPHILEDGDLLTAKDAAVLVYVAEKTDPSLWPAAFADAVAWLLAAELSTALINDARRQQAYMQQYELALAKARADDLSQQQPARHDGPWLTARE